MDIKCIPTKLLYYDWASNYRVWSCRPTSTPHNFTLNKYHSFTIAGNNLDMLSQDNETAVSVEPDASSKYPASYKLITLTGIKYDKAFTVDPEDEYGMLCSFMTSSQADNVHTAYPNFIQLVLNNQEDTIDTKTIYNVGKKRLAEYIEAIRRNCKTILIGAVCRKWGVTSKEAMTQMTSMFPNPNALEQAFAMEPYKVLVQVGGLKFSKADEVILNIMPEQEASQERCLYSCLDILEENETTGCSKIGTDELKWFVADATPECAECFEWAVEQAEYIHLTEDKLWCALAQTYADEALIADNICERLNRPVEEPKMDWEPFKTVDGFEMTDEQCRVLQLVNENNVVMMNGPAGCVDCDTEFFNGQGWKRIADYTEDDKVLQYDLNGNAELVYPERYIKQPCNSLWHFETKYGINQTICDEHNIIYWSPKGCMHECSITDILDKQKGNGWDGRFKTAFTYGGNGIDLSDDEIKIMCAVICDGSFQSHTPNSLLCRFHIKKERKKQALRELFNSSGTSFREKESAAQGYTDFFIYAPRREKQFGPEWYNCSSHQLEIIKDNILQWDGSINTTEHQTVRRSFSTSIKATADFIQFVFTACGYRASISSNNRSGQRYMTCGKEYIRKSVEYDVTITNRTMVGICSDSRSNHAKTPIIQVPTTDGYKYCFTVPSHMLVLRRKNCIFVTGNCGKTSSTKSLIRMLEANHRSYTLLAPTGTAAKRLRESTSRPAYTVHLLCKKEMNYGDYIIIDESSILSISTLAMLLKYIGFAPHLILICDEAQLASIGAGNIVQDLINSYRVPIANLTKIFRYNTSGLITLATDARTGVVDHFEETYPDYTYVPIGSDPLEQIMEQYTGLLNNGYSPNDILILSPYNIGKFGTLAINQTIQERCNSHSDSGVSYNRMLKRGKVNVAFKVGDRILNTHNEYSMPLYSEDEKEPDEEDNPEGDEVPTVPVMNGEIGVVRKAWIDAQTEPHVVAQFDENLVEINKDTLQQMLLGYAISIHKSQGQQAKAVIVVLDKSQARMVSRNLLYVGLSRAQERLVLVGSLEAIEAGLEVVENQDRDTMLCEMVMKGVEMNESI